MKKIISILVTVGFLVTTLAPAAAAGGRGHGHRYHHRHHGHYHGGHHNFWIGLGFGVITGAILTQIHASSPPPRRVVYYDPPPVVVSRSPAVVKPNVYGRALKPTYGTVEVTAAELNMRSGPGLGRAVIGQARKGDVLAVIDSIPDWFYVRKADGRYGWVMDRYTRPSGPVG